MAAVDERLRQKCNCINLYIATRKKLLLLLYYNFKRYLQKKEFRFVQNS
jgi:hypothetical protein